MWDTWKIRHTDTSDSPILASYKWPNLTPVSCNGFLQHAQMLEMKKYWYKNQQPTTCACQNVEAYALDANVS